jgi:hypothetical protein
MKRLSHQAVESPWKGRDYVTEVKEKRGATLVDTTFAGAVDELRLFALVPLRVDRVNCYLGGRQL